MDWMLKLPDDETTFSDVAVKSYLTMFNERTGHWPYFRNIAVLRRKYFSGASIWRGQPSPQWYYDLLSQSRPFGTQQPRALIGCVVERMSLSGK